MARVLWLTPVPPDHRGGGGHLRQAHLLDALVERAEVQLVVSGTVSDESIRSRLTSLAELDVREDDWSRRPRALRRGRDLWLATASRQPREVAAFGPVRRAMREYLDVFTGDAVIVEYAGLGRLVQRSVPGRRQLLTLHNLGSAMSSQAATVAPSGRERWIYRRDALKARRFESAIQYAYDRVITVSSEDAKGFDSDRTAVVPNGVDVGAYPTAPLPEEQILVFTGALYTSPNVEGIRWFCEQILPRIQVEEPAVRLLIVGSRPSTEVRALAHLPAVTLIPDVDSTIPYLQAARVVVVPIRVGSGSRLKALEGLAAARPVVGTTIGLGGLDLRDNRDVLVADSPEQFSEAVTRVLRDRPLAQRLASSGRGVVVERFDWAPIAKTFVDLVLD